MTIVLFVLAILGLIVGYIATDIAFNVAKQREINAWRQDLGFSPRPVRIK